MDKLNEEPTGKHDDEAQPDELADGRWARGWTKAPKSLLVRRDISSEAKVLWCILRIYCRNGTSCWPSHAKLERDLGRADYTIGRLLAELERVRIIRVVHREGQTNVYELFWLEG